MIKHWEYDNGERHYFSASNTFSDRRMAGWHCHLTGKMVEKEVEDWFREYCDGDFEIIFRFNSGDPYIDIRIANKTDASAFLLRWSGNE